MAGWRYWEDLRIGECTQSRPLTVEAQDMRDFAIKYDPQYFHTDPDLAARSPFGGMIGSGLYSCALWRVLDAQENGDIAWVCGIAWENVRWAAPLRPGDVIRARSELVAKRISAKRDDAGIVTLRHAVEKADGTVVISFDSISFVRRASHPSPAPDPAPSPSRSFPDKEDRA